MAKATAGRKGKQANARSIPALQEPIRNNFIQLHKKKIISSAAVALSLIAGLVLIFILGPSFTGRITAGQGSASYTELMDISADNSTALSWVPEHQGELQSFRISGSVTGQGSCQVYLTAGNQRYLVLDTTEPGISPITGNFIGSEGVPENASNESQLMNETSEGASELIQLSLSYEEIPPFGALDGIQGFAGVNGIQPTATFAEVIDASKLCMRWDVQSRENGSVESLCYGADGCCAFIMLPKEENREWNDTLYLYYGEHGTTENNTVGSQLIYADPDAGRVNFSEWESTSIHFVNRTAEEALVNISEHIFNDECMESCVLPLLNESNYTIEIIVDNCTITITNVTYTMKIGADNLPLCAIPAQQALSGGNISINLSLYCSVAGGGLLNYSIGSIDNITAGISGDMLMLIPEPGFTGTRTATVIASSGTLSGNTSFEILIMQGEETITTQGKAEIGKPVQWTVDVNLTTPKTKEIEIAQQGTNISVAARDNGSIIGLDPAKTKVRKNAAEMTLRSYERERKIKEIENQIKKLKGEEEVLESYTLLLVLEENVTEYKVTYYTEAPVLTEEEVQPRLKRVHVSSETHYTDIAASTSIPEAPQGAIRLYWLTPEGRVDVTHDAAHNVRYIDNNSNGRIDRIAWTVPHLSNETYEISLQVLNPYTYLRDGETWTVAFNTTGTGNLTISSPNAGWTEMLLDDTGTFDEMKFVNVSCGEDALSDTLLLIDFNGTGHGYNNFTDNDSVDIQKLLIPDYSCNGTGYLSNYMLRAGYATLLFEFADENGSVSDYAFDPSPITITNCTVLGQSNTTYLLNNDIINYNSNITCMNITGTNVSLDCQNHLIDGLSSASIKYGIYAYYSSATNAAINISNCNLTDWRIYHIYTENAKNVSINRVQSLSSYADNIYLNKGITNISNSNITCTGGGYGIYAIGQGSGNVIVSSTTIASCGDGIWIQSSPNSLINFVNLTNNQDGIHFYAQSNTLVNNTRVNSTEADINVDLTDSDPYCDNNLVNVIGAGGLPIKLYNYSANIGNLTLSGLILCNAPNSNITNVTISNPKTRRVNGITALFSDNLTINRSNLYYSQGISLYKIRNIKIHNTIAESSQLGISFLANSGTADINNFTGRYNDIHLGFTGFPAPSNITVHDSRFHGNITRYAWFAPDQMNVSFYNNLMNSSQYFLLPEGYFSVFQGFNTSLQNGTRIYMNGTQIGGNYWTNSSGNGYSDTCEDADGNGFCDLPFNVTTNSSCTAGVNCGNQTDYLPLSDAYNLYLPTTGRPYINTSTPLNITSNLTCISNGSSDAGGSPVQNITVWYKNGKPMLLLYLPFEGGSSSTWTGDYSGASNTANVVNAVYRSAGGRVGAAYNYSGANTYINVSGSLISAAFTVEFWFRPNREYNWTTGNATFVYHPDYSVYIKNGSLYFNYQGSIANTSTARWRNNTWYHVFASYDGTNQRLYVNGIYNTSATAAEPLEILDSSGTAIATLYYNGDIVLKGSCSATASCPDPGDDSVVFKNSAGAIIASINSTGGLCIEDTNCNGGDAACENPADGSFVMLDATGTPSTYISPTGALCTLGTITQNGNP